MIAEAIASPEIQIAGMVIASIGTCYTAWLGYLVTKLRLAEQARTEAMKTVGGKIDDLAVIAQAIHKETNERGVINQMKIAAAALRRVADLTSDPADIEAAREAEHMVADHVMRQTLIDRFAPRQETENDSENHL